VAYSENDNALTKTPFEFLSYSNPYPTPQTYRVVLNRYSGSGTPRLKLIYHRSNLTSVEYPTSTGGDIVGPTVTGHSGAVAAMSVAAVPYDNSHMPESFTSHGPKTNYWGPVDGSTPAGALGAPKVLSKPDVAATDGGQTTFFIGDPPYRFYGTSAAAPHAAAVAALMLDGFPEATVAQIRNGLRSTARPVGRWGTRSVGAGLIDARPAVASVLPSVSVGDVTKPEGDSGIRVFAFKLTLSKASATTARVLVKTQTGSAVSGSDFVAKTATVTFLPGQTVKYFSVKVNGDTTVEPDELFTVRLSIPNHLKVDDGEGVATVTNDD
jgi:subtilisin family serine protease